MIGMYLGVILQMMQVHLGVILYRTIVTFVLSSRYAIGGKLSCCLCSGGDTGHIYWSPELQKGV